MGVLVSCAPGEGDPSAVALAADFTSTTATPGANATNLVAALAAATSYFVRCRFTLTNARVSLWGPSGMTGVGRLLAKPDPTNTGARTTVDVTFGAGASAAVGHATLDTEGELWAHVTTTDAGDLSVRGSSNVGATTHTRLRAGSGLEVRAVDGVTVDALASDASTTSATGVDTALSLPVAANKVYLVRMYGRATGNGASARFAWTIPAGATILGWHTGFATTAGSEANRQEVTTAGAVTTNTSSNGAAVGAVHTWLRVKTGGTAGNVTQQIATSLAGTSITLHAGSVLTCDEIAAEV